MERIASLSDFNETNIFDRFSTNTQTSNVMKIRPVGGRFLVEKRWTDGRTDKTKLTVTFWNFMTGPKTACTKYLNE